MRLRDLRIKKLGGKWRVVVWHPCPVRGRFGWGQWRFVFPR